MFLTPGFKVTLRMQKQFSIVNGYSSEDAFITCGVPQESVQGPLLFLLHVIDMSSAVPGEKLRLLADDICL